MSEGMRCLDWCQGTGSVSDALRETWELYEQRAASGRPVPVQFLVNAWGSGYGDCAEARF